MQARAHLKAQAHRREGAAGAHWLLLLG